MLHDMEQDLCVSLGEQLPDFEDTYHSCSDEQLEEMADQFARTYSAPNTTPIYV